VAGEIVFALYRPRPGKANALLDVLRTHVPTLRAEGLATSRPVVLARARSDGTLVEVFEWASGSAAAEAHQNARVQAIWSAMEGLCDFVRWADLAEAAERFPHLDPVDDVTV
jgi:quinol monooxygenase YgiN